MLTRGFTNILGSSQGVSWVLMFLITYDCFVFFQAVSKFESTTC